MALFTIKKNKKIKKVQKIEAHYVDHSPLCIILPFNITLYSGRPLSQTDTLGYKQCVLTRGLIPYELVKAITGIV